MPRKGLLLWLACALSGAMGFVGWIGFDQVYLNWVFLIPVLWAMEGATPKRAFFQGWLFGTVLHGGGFYWMHHLLTEFGNVNFALAWIGVAGIGVYHGIGVALWAMLLQRIRTRAGWSPYAAAAGLWVVLEHFYPFLFPMYLGAGHYHFPAVLQIADLTGAVGTSALVVWLNVVIFEALYKRLTKRATAIFGVAVMLVLAYGYWRMAAMEAAVEAAPKIRVGMVQTNLGARDKTKNPRRFYQKHVEMSVKLDRDEKLDLLMWPESVITLRMSADTKSLSRPLYPGATPLLLGLVTRETVDGEVRPYSHAMLVDDGGAVLGTYIKRRLVPFGEYIPAKDWLPFLDGWSPHQGNYQTGKSLAPIPFREFRLSPSICYEDIHRADVRDLMIGHDPEKLPHAMVNLTNDSWYGDTIEPQQHLILATLRCIEHRRAMARSTNTGVSAFIGPDGRLVKRTGQWEEATLVGDLPMLEGRTLYSLLGDWFAWLALAWVAVAVGRSFARR